MRFHKRGSLAGIGATDDPWSDRRDKIDLSTVMLGIVRFHHGLLDSCQALMGEGFEIF